MSTKRLILAVGAAIGIAGGAMTASAHHSFAAEFDRNKPVHLEGTVVEFQWVNPHSWLIIDVEQEDGSMERWAVEGGAPSALLRRGWTRDTLPAGTRVSVDGFQAKDGKPRANANNIVFPDGKSMRIGSSGIGAAPGADE
jgi:sarcosine oxidase gamma subunit